jgi:hypothetical protein
VDAVAIGSAPALLRVLRNGNEWLKAEKSQKDIRQSARNE